jgi:sterol desaturase/sphingolipid hydroxylase (fatty acid hydroxylase superfamily)
MRYLLYFYKVENLREQILILVSTPLYLIIIGLEILLSNYRHRSKTSHPFAGQKPPTKTYTWKDTLTNVYLMLLNGLIDLLFRGVYLVILDLCYRHHWISLTSAFSYWFLLLLAEDFLYYWLHRWDHEIRLFWAVHVTHHSSEYMNFTVGFRSSVFQPLYRFVYFIPLALVGFRPLDIIFMYSATQIWGIFVHTELINKMGWLEYILVTPSHHRVHHRYVSAGTERRIIPAPEIWPDKIPGKRQPRPYRVP